MKKQLITLLFITSLTLVTLACGLPGGAVTISNGQGTPQLSVDVPEFNTDDIGTSVADANEVLTEAGIDSESFTATVEAFDMNNIDTTEIENLLEQFEGVDTTEIEELLGNVNGEQIGEALATVQAMDYGTEGEINAIEEKLNSAVADENGNYIVNITVEEFNSVFRAQEANMPPEEQVLRNVNVSFIDNQVNMTADVVKPVATTMDITMTPLITDGALSFNVTSATIAGMAVPDTLLTMAESSANNILVGALDDLPADMTVQSIAINGDTMTITASRTTP